MVDGTGVPGADLILIERRSWVRVVGLELRNNLGVDDGSGIRVIGAGSHVELRDNHIHDIRDDSAMGITVYGTVEGFAANNLACDVDNIGIVLIGGERDIQPNANLVARNGVVRGR